MIFCGLLYARIGEAYSYNTGRRMVKFSEEEIVANIFQKFNGKKYRYSLRWYVAEKDITANFLKTSGKKDL